MWKLIAVQEDAYTKYNAKNAKGNMLDKQADLCMREWTDILTTGQVEKRNPCYYNIPKNSMTTIISQQKYPL